MAICLVHRLRLLPLRRCGLPRIKPPGPFRRHFGQYLTARLLVPQAQGRPSRHPTAIGFPVVILVDRQPTRPYLHPHFVHINLSLLACSNRLEAS